MITLDDLIDRFGKQELANLTDRENYAVINEDVVNKAISDAEIEVVSYLNAVGLVDFDATGVVSYRKLRTPDALIVKTCDITRYYLHEDGVIDIVQKRYDNAVKWLKLVMKNPEMLTGNTLSEPIQNTGICVMPNVMPNQFD